MLLQIKVDLGRIHKTLSLYERQGEVEEKDVIL